MRLYRFPTQVLLRIAALTATLTLLVVLLHARDFPITSLAVGMVAVAQIIMLLRFVERANNRLVKLLEAISYSDFSSSFATGFRGSGFSELDAAFAHVVKRFREARMQREEATQFLQAVVHQLRTGLMVVREGGHIELMNEAAQRLLGVSRAADLEALGAQCPALVNCLQAREGHLDEVLQLPSSEAQVELLVQASDLRLRNTRLTLITLHNIGNQLEAKERESWHNMVRVFTHEIKNSLTPIASLAATVDELLPPQGSGLADSEADMRQALGAIRLRSEGLLEFVDRYRELTRVPIPQIEIVQLSALFQRMNTLVAAQLAEQNIQLTIVITPSDLYLSADPKLLEQLLLNLLLNALEALSGQDQGQMELRAERSPAGRVVIEVTDNGPGISPQALPRLFVPFFSTKTSGSGIGLSLSRQIMRLHGGELTVRSQPKVETVFTLKFL